MEAPPSLLRRAVHEQIGNRVELESDVEPNPADRRLVANARADRVTELALAPLTTDW
jgi:hypothetical protein